MLVMVPDLHTGNSPITHVFGTPPLEFASVLGWFQENEMVEVRNETDTSR